MDVRLITRQRQVLHLGRDIKSESSTPKTFGLQSGSSCFGPFKLEGLR